jgi:hypothetical protein
MNKLIYIALLLLTTGLFVTGCKKEAALTASEDNQGYTLPQGYHSYDTTILNLYNKFGTYFLYKFTDKDTYWTPTGWKNAIQTAPGTWNTGYEVTKADTNYISRQLALINKGWFSFYNDQFLLKFLPAKIMLCGSVDSIYTTYIFTPTFQAVKATKSVGAWYNYDNICINYGSAGVTTMTGKDSIAFMAKCNLIFIQSIYGRNLTPATNDFTSVANYSVTLSTQAAAYAQGIITIYYNSRSPQLDWNAYLEAMVSRSEANLNKSTVNTDMTSMGMLNATKDTNGKIRQRYNIIRNYFISTYGVDLQAIGNAVDK